MAQPKECASDKVMGVGRIESYGERGVWVPEGLTARQIMHGAAVLEHRFEVDHYLACSMVTAVLEALSSGEPREPSGSR